MKRKRTAEPASPVRADLAPASGSESDVDEQETGPSLDSFEEGLAQPIEALNAAVDGATALLQPSEHLASLARAAARVSRKSLHCISAVCAQQHCCIAAALCIALFLLVTA